jgi:excisionase family DNA binding protein
MAVLGGSAQFRIITLCISVELQVLFNANSGIAAQSAGQSRLAMNEARRSYTTRELAEQLGVSVQTVQRWVDAGHIKAWKTVGGHRKIDAESADSWVRQMQAGPPPEAPASEPRRVLLVDDDPAFLEILAMLVADHAPKALLDTATSGFQALQILATTTPDLLVTDVAMPHMDGFEMLRHVASQERRPGFVVVTSSLDREEVARYGQLSPDMLFMPKPIDQAAFIALLGDRLGSGA